jgi:pimeloyl-ACP methyl ester carboxylesterase
MANYVLVHGGDRDGSLWDSVKILLEKQGHRVFCPSMSSIKTTTLQENVNEVVQYIQSHNLESFILVGHSYGGFVVTGVTNAIPTQVDMLIYVDSLLPKNGKSLYDIVTIDYASQDPACDQNDKAVISKLYFDTKTVFSRKKAYVHCLKSEFFELTKFTYKEIKDAQNDWLIFCLDTSHSPMLTHPKELAVIFLGCADLLT